jgi:hypothetical protein
MTTVYLAAGAAQPGTHVLIIGIGAYTHLTNGPQEAANTFDMGQLSSPPVSAKAMIDWFLGPLLDPNAPGFRNLTSPLLSVEALIAADQPVTVQAPSGPVPLDGARLDQVRAAYNQWRQRLIAQPGSIGIFFFCGHGVSGVHQYALCQDFLSDDAVPLEKSFNVDATLQALGKEAQDSDLHFWFDACRIVEPSLFYDAGKPYGLRHLNPLQATVERSHSFLRATGDGMAAFAKNGKPSRFTQALLNSLSGYAGTSRPGNRWEVGASELHVAVGKFLEFENKSAQRRQSCAHDVYAGGNAIVELAGPPKVRLSLNLKPEEMRAFGQLFYQQCDGAAEKSVHPCIDGELRVDIDVGYYNLGAEAPQGQFQPTVHPHQLVSPPLWDHVFEVTP